MKNRYQVQCWVRPKSGFDLARKNRIIRIFKETMDDNLKGYVILKDLKKYIEKIEKESDGLVIEPLIVESDEAIVNFEKQVMPNIRKKYPEAKLFDFLNL